MSVDPFSKGAADLFNKAGVAGVFNPAAGAAVSCRVNLEHDQQLSGLETGGQVVSLGTTIEYRLAEIGRAVRDGETFTVDGTVYTISDQVANDGLIATVIVT